MCFWKQAAVQQADAQDLWSPAPLQVARHELLTDRYPIVVSEKVIACDPTPSQKIFINVSLLYDSVIVAIRLFGKTEAEHAKSHHSISFDQFRPDQIEIQRSARKAMDQKEHRSVTAAVSEPREERPPSGHSARTLSVHRYSR